MNFKFDEKCNDMFIFDIYIYIYMLCKKDNSASVQLFNLLKKSKRSVFSRVNLKSLPSVCYIESFN
jgi:hypothetical protein